METDTGLTPLHEDPNPIIYYDSEIWSKDSSDNVGYIGEPQLIAIIGDEDTCVGFLLGKSNLFLRFSFEYKISSWNRSGQWRPQWKLCSCQSSYRQFRVGAQILGYSGTTRHRTSVDH